MLNAGQTILYFSQVHYNEASTLDPENVTYESNKAAVYFEKKEYETCIEVCTKAIEAYVALSFVLFTCTLVLVSSSIFFRMVYTVLPAKKGTTLNWLVKYTLVSGML